MYCHSLKLHKHYKVLSSSNVAIEYLGVSLHVALCNSTNEDEQNHMQDRVVTWCFTAMWFETMHYVISRLSFPLFVD
jgi:hypothetical protein